MIPELLISLDQLLTFLTAAWHMVSEVLPEVVTEDPPWVPLAGCPLVRCELWAAQDDNPADCLSLADIVDFCRSAAARAPRHPLRRLARRGPPRRG